MVRLAKPISIFCLGLALALPAAARAPSVEVNDALLQSLGQTPNVPTQYMHAIRQEQQKPSAPRRPVVAAPAVLPTPPLKKPRSQWNQQLVASAKKSPTGKQRRKFDSKTPTQALQFSQPVMAMAGAGVGMGFAGYRWQDIDPRTRGAMPLPQSGDNTGRTIGSVTFNPGSDELNATARNALQPVAKNLQADPGMAELRGYATPDKESGDDAKRVALSRVISVRDHLIGLGVPGNQLGVKPVGLAPDGPKERVDIVRR